MKYTKNNYDKKEFRKIFNYMCQQFDYTSIEEKEILKLYLQKKNYPTNENQNNKNHINAKKKGENNTATKPYKCNTSPTRQNKDFEMIPYNKKPMSQQHQQQLQQQQQPKEEGQEEDKQKGDSANQSEHDSSHHSGEPKQSDSSDQHDEDNHEKNQENYQKEHSSNQQHERETHKNNSSDQSQQQQQHEQQQYPLSRISPDIPIISQEQVLENFAKFGKITKYRQSNYTHIRLYRHPTSLTTEEYEHANKYYFFRYQMNQKPCRNNSLPLDLSKKTMFRCRLPACKHRPLNNLRIHQSLKNHCQFYHNDGNNYIFHYKADQIWKTFSFPPKPNDKNNTYNDTQQYNIQKGKTVFFNSDVNSNNSNEWKGKNPLPTLPNTLYDKNRRKGKGPTLPLPHNYHYQPNKYKGKRPYTNLPNNTCDKNDHNGKNPIPTLQNNTYDKKHCKGKNPFTTLPNNNYYNPNEYKGKGPSTTSPQIPQYVLKCKISYQHAKKYEILVTIGHFVAQ